MEKNVGEIDAYIRITGGLTLLASGIICKSRTMSLLGSMKVAEGITRFCPMLYILNMSTNKLDMDFPKIRKKTADPMEQEQTQI